MPEGLATAAGDVIGEGVYDDPEHPPSADECARLGWDKGATWDRRNRRWKPKVRGPLLPPLRGRAQQQDESPEGTPAAGDDDGQGPAAGDYRDPDPSWGADAPGGGPAPEPFRVDSETRKDIKALVALAYTIPGEALPLLDPYCFGVLEEEETTKGIVTAVSDIVCGSPRVARWAASAAGLMPWIKLGIALKPVAVAALHHHILRDVEVEIDRATKTMTVSRQDWAQYPAA